MPNSLLSNLKIGNKGPYWLNVPYFNELTVNGTNWTYTTDIDLKAATMAIGTQIIIKAPAALNGDITFNGIKIICNKGGLSTSSYPVGSYLQLVYDGTNWVVLN